MKRIILFIVVLFGLAVVFFLTKKLTVLAYVNDPACRNIHCISGYHCVSGNCVKNGTGTGTTIWCTNSSECPAGYVCSGAISGVKNGTCQKGGGGGGGTTVPTATPTPKPTCVPPPGCLYAIPPCKIQITTNMCPLSTPTPTPATSACPLKSQGDANCDGKVDLTDYFYFVSKSSGGVVPASINLDFNGDGKVDSADRSIVVQSVLTNVVNAQ